MSQREMIKPLYGVPEEWRQYKNTNYYVSNQGRVSKHYKNGNKIEIGFWKETKRYRFRAVHIFGKNKKIAHMVYETFIGEIPKGYAVIHKNGVVGDDTLFNLGLSVPKEIGEKNGYKAKSQKVYCKANKKIYRSSREAARNLPITSSTICDICNGKVKKPTMDFYWYDSANDEVYKGKYRNVKG